VIFSVKIAAQVCIQYLWYWNEWWESFKTKK